MGRGKSNTSIAAPLRSKPQLVDHTPFTSAEIERYCDRILDAANVGSGDIAAFDLQYASQLPMVDHMRRAADRRDALVEVLVHQDKPLKEQVDNLVGSNAVFISMKTHRPLSEGPIGLFAAQVPSSANPFEAYNTANAENDLRWNVSIWPTPAWAQSVYPELEPPEAYRQLGQDLLSFMRASDGDKPDAWDQHLASLQRRAQKINKAQIKSLRFETADTSLTMDVAEGAKFLPTQWETVSGNTICVNSPTEEIFTTPDPQSVSGTFKASKPLMDGNLAIEGVEGRFEDGKLVELTCPDERHLPRLKDLLTEYTGTHRLGEVGLVDQQGPIAKTGRLYNENTIDENAGVHLGFGRSYDAITGGQGNEGLDHLDMVIGTSQMRVIGVTQSGEELPLIENGSWQV